MLEAPAAEYNSAFTTLQSFKTASEQRNNHSGKPDACQGCALINEKMVNSDGVKFPDILLVGGLPTERDLASGAFTSKAAMMVRSMMDRITKDIPVPDHPKRAYTYAVRCPMAKKVRGDGTTGGPPDKVDINTIEKCRVHLRDTILRYKPKLVLAFGSDALKGMDFKGKFNDVRGVFMPKREGDFSYTLLPTLHPFAVTADPGKFDLLYEDLEKAINFIRGKTEKIELDIRTPRKFDDVMAELVIMEEYITTRAAGTDQKLAVSVDTETTSLDPWRPGERVIVISMSYKDRFGLAFPFEHREEFYTPEQFAQIRASVERILSTDCVAVIEHNAKFDTQWLLHKYKMKMNPAAFCTMVGEHALFEDKKGNYDLKTLTSDNFPSLGQYEEELHRQLDALKVAREAAYSELEKARKAEVKAVFVEEWMSLDENARLSRLANWVNRGFLPMGRAPMPWPQSSSARSKASWLLPRGTSKR